MIQSQELRISNYIIREDLFDKNKRIEKITELYKEKALCSGPISVFVDYKDLQPIPLTEEILLKFGLKKIDDNLWQYKNGYLIGFYTKRWFIGKYNFDDMVEMITSFYYAHQLQNLYFALTGEELTFNIFVKNA